MSEREIPEFAREVNRREMANGFHGFDVEYKPLQREQYYNVLKNYLMAPFGPRYEEVVGLDIKKSFEQYREVEEAPLRDHVEIIIARCTNVLRQPMRPANISEEILTAMIYTFNMFVQFQQDLNPMVEFKKFTSWPDPMTSMEVE